MTQPFEILIGDCREQLKTLPDKSVHCVVTSPPYFGLREYGENSEAEIGMEKTVEEHFAVLIDVFREVHRVMRDDATLWFNYGDKWDKNGNQLLLPSRSAWKLHELLGFIIRAENIWEKPNAIPSELARKRTTYAHEHMFHLVKMKPYYYDFTAIQEKKGDEPDWEEYEASLGSNNGADSLRWSAGYKKCSHSMTHPDGRNKRSVWKIPTRAFPAYLKEKFGAAHYATFPPELVEPCILAGTSEKGCCPACGAPWQRNIEPTPEYAALLGKGWHDHEDDFEVGQRGTPPAFKGQKYITKGWKPGCECNAGDPVPCTVLDPFNGSGTTGEVALKHFRNYIGVELYEINAQMTEYRLNRLLDEGRQTSLLSAL